MEKMIFLSWADMITFEQFVQYVSATDDAELDIHCKPQSYFLGNFNYDFVAKMEHLDRDLTLLEKRLKLPFKIKRFNKTTYSEYREDDKPYSTFTSAEVRALNSKVPNYKRFYTPELIEIVGKRYGEDVKKFSYSFLT